MLGPCMDGCHDSSKETSVLTNHISMDMVSTFCASKTRGCIECLYARVCPQSRLYSPVDTHYFDKDPKTRFVVRTTYWFPLHNGPTMLINANKKAEQKTYFRNSSYAGATVLNPWSELTTFPSENKISKNKVGLH